MEDKLAINGCFFELLTPLLFDCVILSCVIFRLNVSHGVLVFTQSSLLSDKVERLYPVTNNTANQGGTRLIPASLMTPDLMAAVSGDPVVSTTLADLVTFAGADTVIMKLDIEV